MIEVHNLSKTFYVHRKKPGLLASVKSLISRTTIEKKAVRNISFKVGEGEIVGLIGSNGAGKTTVVKMLAGIIHPTSGDASVLGYRPWERDNRLRSRIALIMGQKAQLWWDLPAADCFLLLKEIYKIPAKQYDSTLQHLADVLGVQDQLQIQIRRLSLGERMKMELIAALLHRPRVVYLDEPTIGLDLNAQRAIREFILQYRQEFSPAMLLTSHYMEDIERLCRRIIILRDGELVYDGSLARVVEEYATEKIVKARLSEVPERGIETRRDELERLGRVLDAGGELIRLQVRRAEVAAAAAWLISHFSVSDLSIEEEDIGTIIANIMTTRETVSET